MSDRRYCSVPECGKAHNARGLCHTHYVSAHRSGELPARTDRAYTWEALIERGRWDGECLRWCGPRNANGYGRVSWKGTSFQVHRLAYTLRVGDIPEGLEVDHVLDRGCLHRDCFNPDHLEPVTSAENVRRQARHATGICPYGHPLSPRNDGTGQRVCVECRRVRQTEKVTCQCGKSVSRNNLRIHQTRRVHIEAIGKVHDA